MLRDKMDAGSRVRHTCSVKRKHGFHLHKLSAYGVQIEKLRFSAQSCKCIIVFCAV